MPATKKHLTPDDLYDILSAAPAAFTNGPDLPPTKIEWEDGKYILWSGEFPDRVDPNDADPAAEPTVDGWAVEVTAMDMDGRKERIRFIPLFPAGTFVVVQDIFA